MRARDYVCRWGGDEFVAILACDLAIAESRSRQIAERLNGPYQIAGAAGAKSASISPSPWAWLNIVPANRLSSSSAVSTNPCTVKNIPRFQAVSAQRSRVVLT